MSLLLENYNLGYRIVSLALDETAKAHLLADNLELIYVENEKIVLLPDGIILSERMADISKIQRWNNYDVLDILENGLVSRKYNDKSDDNYFFVTGGCNSNCIMCPSPDVSRKNVSPTNVEDLISLAKHIPSDTSHLTITGGEPFLIGEAIFPFIRFLKERFNRTEFLFLTNGRVFALDKYLHLFLDSVPTNSIVAIPIHGSCEQIHDAVTRSDGSFKQTKHGIKQLIRHGVHVELRLVANKLNIKDFENIADLIIRDFHGIDYVSVIAMEMTGNARINQEKVWVPYKETFSAIAGAIRKMVEGGIDVKLYNFPLCTVKKPFWTLCEKSISPNKVHYAAVCETCKYKPACGGVFAGTYLLEKEELEAIL